MQKWAREKFQPCIPLGENHTRITECETNRQLSYEAACEGSVLLKNNNDFLPIGKGTAVAVFGKAQADYVKGGGGSGDVTVSYVKNIYEGLKNRADRITIFDRLSMFYKEYVDNELKNGAYSGDITEPPIPAELLEESKKLTDTAIIVINRFSQEGIDRKNDEADSYFNLRAGERELVETVTANFEHIVVLLNVGAMIDVSWFAYNDKIEAALMLWQGGMEGGFAAADIITGIVNPSGKLTDTCAARFSDYPSSEGFYESDDYVKYIEDIFVGYRYFETIPDKKECVVYPFGYGLSYTEFSISDAEVNQSGNKINISLVAANIGKTAGKEVIQVYLEAPEGNIAKPKKVLCAFEKTDMLEAGESQRIQLSFDITDFASYDDMGAIQKSAYILEKGIYNILIGSSVRDAAQPVYSFNLSENVIVEQLNEYCAPERLGKRLISDGTYIDVPDIRRSRKTFKREYGNWDYKKRSDVIMLLDVAEGKSDMDEFISQLTDDELIYLLEGHKNRGVANTCGMGDLEKYGIPPVMTADGPAGVRINAECGVNTTAFPVATLLACTWNIPLIERIGKAGALEAKENNLSIWLTPALNIHRSPLCGRNFEYFSEDPLVSGKMAAAMVRGIQSENIVAVPKHFACNNKETNRYESDSIISERAIREIYIKGFEICVRESKPWMIMTSYNLINGVRSSENTELIAGILRDEWGYKGMITSDWENHAEHWKEIKAGNDVKMPYGQPEKVKEALNDGKVTREELAECVSRLLNMIIKLQ